MDTGSWIQEFPSAITVCDGDGKILAMNDRACATFERDGGAALIGTHLSSCHPAAARTILEHLLASQRPNCCTIEKEGVKKLIYQAPWYEGGKYRGIVEISIPLPDNMPHFNRDRPPQ